MSLNAHPRRLTKTWHDGTVVDEMKPVARWRRASREAIVGSTGALIGELGLGPGGAVLGATVPVYAFAALDAFGARLSATRRAKAYEMLEIAAAETGSKVDDVLAAIRSPEQELVAGRAIRAATDTAMRAKIRALGSALGRVLAMDDVVEVCQESLILDALADIEVQHALVLYDFARSINLPMLPPSTPGEWDSVAVYAPALDRASLARRVPSVAIALDGAMATLERHGLISEVPIDYIALIDQQARNSVRKLGTSNPPRRWKITELGVATLRLLLDSGTDWVDNGPAA